MTKITFYQTKDGRNAGFEVIDHSGYDEEGRDIVCAAISALTINTVNSIEEFTADLFELETDEDNALIRLKISPEHSPEADLLLNSYKLGISNISDDESYSDYMKLNFQEV